MPAFPTGWKPVLLILLCATTAGAAPAIIESQGSFTSDGRKILVENYLPATSGRHPAIILLHGSAGVLFPGLDLRARARDLAGRGYAVFLPHFFNRTGHIMVWPAQVHENLPVWTRTVQDTITYISTQPRVNARRSAVMGHSLGGYLALSSAARDRRIDAVIEASGALDQSGIKRMPPTLILHGAKDETVPVAKANRLESLLKKLGTPYQKHIYPREAHRLSRSAMGDASQRIERFLLEYFPSKGTAVRD